MNMQALMREAQKMKKELESAQKELENAVYEGESSLVKVKINGKKKILSVKIDSSNIEKDEIEMLEDMILLAINDAGKKVDEEQEKKFNKYGKGLSGLF